MHNQEFERSIMGLESCLPFVAISDLDKVVSTLEVKFGELLGGL